MCYPGTYKLSRDDDRETINRRSGFAKNNLVRKIVAVKRADQRRMVGVNESSTKKLVRSRLPWAGRVKGMADECGREQMS